MRLFHAAGMVLALFSLGGCISPYKVEVQQGNVVTQDMLEKLKPGLTKSQVRFVLGTPLITDPFHPQRWDYVYIYKRHARDPGETRKLTVIFDGDALARTEGDMLPAATAESEPPTGSADDTQPAPLPAEKSARAL